MADDKPLLVFFTSRRSGPARRMESLLAHLARKERTRVHVMRVLRRQPDGSWRIHRTIFAPGPALESP